MASGDEVEGDDGRMVDKTVEAGHPEVVADVQGLHHTVQGLGATMTCLRLDVGYGITDVSADSAHHWL